MLRELARIYMPVIVMSPAFTVRECLGTLEYDAYVLKQQLRA